MNWKQYQELDSEEHIHIDGVISDRVCGNADEPFLVEPFCAQVSWTKKGECPVYPYNFEGEAICHYMYREGYENYRCPNVRVAIEIFNPIIEKGSKEQKEALEYLARVWKRYALMENPLFEKRDGLAYETTTIFFNLGLIKEGMEIIEKFPHLSKITTPEDEARRINLARLDNCRIKSNVPFSQRGRIVP